MNNILYATPICHVTVIMNHWVKIMYTKVEDYLTNACHPCMVGKCLNHKFIIALIASHVSYLIATASAWYSYTTCVCENFIIKI